MPQPNITTGDRSARRVADVLFTALTPSNADKLCEAINIAVCDYRFVILDNMIDDSPDIFNASLRRTLTDIATASDMALGGKCVIKCKLTPEARDDLITRLGQV
ncbi:hypothetical protein LCGC14_0224480 [marine sediment metagenome]|uniref:Uncharacterized protein n=1 Tax=marine sediment metagenome TaxID=412755 RepID=A0A0F9UGT5_9ZZZZ|nr:hypothetical protein [bacterium]